MQRSAPGSTATLRGSLAEGRADAYSDIDIFWEIPDALFQPSVRCVADILTQAHPLESLRSSPDFQRSDRRRMFFAQFQDMPLFWRADIDVFAQSVERNLAYDRGNPLARGGPIAGEDWSLTHSALMNAIAAVKALLRGQEQNAALLLARGFQRVGLAVPAQPSQKHILLLAQEIAARDPAQTPLAGRIIELYWQALAEE